jgi:hypothetical protein
MGGALAAFDYLITFFSFAFALAMTHILYAVVRMIRHRRELTFSWEHALWMANALLLLLSNWLSLFDFRGQQSFDLDNMATLFLLVVAIYFACALASPDFEDREDYDMTAFHRREGRTYIGAMAALILLALIANIDATDEGVSLWGAENRLVVWMVPVTILPMIFRDNRWIQLACPIIFIGLNLAFMIIFYPVIN